MSAVEPFWLSEKSIRAMHEALIARTGGSLGVLNLSALDSTVQKPINTYLYEESPSWFRLAAVYAYGFVKNHCFVDGNKRIALACMSVFLIRNGYNLTASEAEAVKLFLELASSLESQEEALDKITEWLKLNTTVRM